MDNSIPIPADRPEIKMALVIEDDPELSELLAFHLKQASYTPLIFSNAEDVLLLLRTFQMKIILIDLLLPGMDAVAFVREIEQRKRRTAPILMISGDADGASRAQEVHAEGYLQKPFSFTKLIQVVNMLVWAYAAQQRYEEQL
jgi:DNA-binding response OmpR family regulator